MCKYVTNCFVIIIVISRRKGNLCIYIPCLNLPQFLHMQNDDAISLYFTFTRNKAILSKNEHGNDLMVGKVGVGKGCLGGVQEGSSFLQKFCKLRGEKFMEKCAKFCKSYLFRIVLACPLFQLG